MAIRLVIFDWTGVVADFGAHGPAESLVRALAMRGMAVPMDEARAVADLSERDQPRALLGQYHLRVRWQQLHRRDWTDDDLTAIARDMTTLRRQSAGRHTGLSPGLRECVIALRERQVQIGLTINACRDAAALCLGAARSEGLLLKATACADDVPAGRPAPWMVFRVMERAGVYPPGDVARIAGSLTGIVEGINAGCRVGAVLASSALMGLTAAQFDALPDDERQRRLGSVRRQFLDAGAEFTADTLDQLPDAVAALPDRGR